jgi:hypothetical protein
MRENSYSYRDSNSDPSVVQPVSSGYSDGAIRLCVCPSRLLVMLFTGMLAMIAYAMDNCFALIDLGQMGLKRNTTAGGRRDASSVAIDGTSL